MRVIFIALILIIFGSCSSYESEAEILKKFDSIRSGIPKGKASIKKRGEMLICIPSKKEAKMPVLFIFGGMYYATPEFMLKETPESLFEKAVVVFAPCMAVGGKGFKSYHQQLLKFLKKEGISIREMSVCGFSGGGPDALEAEGADISLIGLIDAVPEIPKRQKFPMLINSFNRKNWFDNELYGKATGYSKFDAFKKWTKKEGGFVEENNVRHEQFPKYFLYRYRKNLIK